MTELDEPKLKYKRIRNEVNTITSQDEITCVAVHAKLIAVGTRWGNIYLLDHMGYLIQKRKNVHSTVINEMSIDEQGNYMASCSDDGKAMVHNLCGDTTGNLICFERPIKAVAIAPDFTTTQKFITGDDRLTLVGKSLLRGPTSQVLHGGEGTIRTIRWHGQFVAWSCDPGVHVYDMKDSALITLVPRKDQDLRVDLHLCSIAWVDATTFLIGWGRTVQVCRIVPRQDATAGQQLGPVGAVAGAAIRSTLTLASGGGGGPGSRDMPRLPKNSVQIVKWFRRPNDIICGVAPHKSDILVLLYPNPVQEDLPTPTNPETSTSDGTATESVPPPAPAPVVVCPKPRILLAEALVNNYNKKSEDQLPVRGHEKLACAQYHLESAPGENTHFLVSPKDLVSISECEMDDLMDWLINHEQYPRALALAEEHARTLKNHTVQSVGVRYIDFLLNARQFEEAARQCSKVLTKPDSWKTITYNFAQCNELQAIAPMLPTSNPRLDREVYELVLNYFLLYDLAKFLEYLQKWLNTSDTSTEQIFDCRTLIQAVLRERQKQEHSIGGPLSPDAGGPPVPVGADQWSMSPREQVYQRCLALLYEGEGSFHNALTIYLWLGDHAVFPLIEKHKLFPSALTFCGALLHLDKDAALRLLLDHIEVMPVTKVVEQLQQQQTSAHNAGDQQALFYYLDALTARQTVRERKSVLPEPYHNLLVELYVKYNRDKLLPFLRSSDHYDLNRALALCQNERFDEERVFLLSRMGRKLDALSLILHGLKDIGKAIEFCREEGDRDLWERLILYSSEEPRFIQELLENTGMDIDPQLLIQKIHPNMQIPGLRRSLVKLLHDYQVQVQLREGCQKIFFHDLQNILVRQVRLQRRAMGPLELPKLKCCVCGGPCSLDNAKVASAANAPRKTAPSMGAEKQSFVVFHCQHIYHVGCYPEPEITQCLEC